MALFGNASSSIDVRAKRPSGAVSLSVVNEAAAAPAVRPESVTPAHDDCWRLLDQAILALEQMQGQCLRAENHLAEIQHVHRKALSEAHGLIARRDAQIGALQRSLAVRTDGEASQPAPPIALPAAAPIDPAPIPPAEVADASDGIFVRNLDHDRDVMRFRRHLRRVVAAA